MREPLLTPEEESQLAGDIEVGVFAAEALKAGESPGGASGPELEGLVAAGAAAWDRFLMANAGLVGSLARKECRHSGLPFGDLYQEAFLGLIQALRRYDFSRGGFATYAAIWIRSYLAQAAASRCGLAYVSQARFEEVRRLRWLESELAQRLRRSPSSADLAEATGRSQAWVEDVLSGEYPRALSPEVEAVPVLEPESGPEPSEVWALIARLPALEGEVVRRRYGGVAGRPRSYLEVGRCLGIDPTSARRAELRALGRMRSVLRAEAAA